MCTPAQQMEEDDKFFSDCLNLIPRRFIVPLSDSEKEELREKSLPAKKTSAAEKKSKKILVSHTTTPKKSNAELIGEAFLKQKKEAEMHLLQHPMEKQQQGSEVATLSELRARLQVRMEENRKKAGKPGARAERDKLLPPKPVRVRQEVITKEVTDSPLPPPTTTPVVVNLSQKKKTPSKTESTIEERISYGALKVTTSSDPKDTKSSTKSILNLKKLIKQAQDGQARVEELKADGKIALVKEERWDVLEKKATGEKIRDDPRLLKKALKGLQKKKEKSAKSRKEREKKSEEGKMERIANREKNITERKHKQIEKRGGRKRSAATPAAAGSSSAPTPRTRAGFEGRPAKKPKTQSV